MLTGNVKLQYESSLFGRGSVVLMVEGCRGQGPCDQDGLPAYLPGTYWRKAEADDMQYLRVRAELA